MPNFRTKQEVKKAELAITVIRADGSKEDLGVVSSSSKWWNWGLGRWRARRRIERANRRADG